MADAPDEPDVNEAVEVICQSDRALSPLRELIGTLGP